MSSPLIYVAGSGGAGLNSFVSPSLDVDGAPYGGTISTLEVKVNGTVVTSGYSVVDDVITFAVDLVAGDVLEMRRLTPYQDSLVVFPSPTRYSAVDNNKSLTQLLYNIQDLWGYISTYCAQLVSNLWDAKDKRIVNVADPIDSTDAANLQTVQNAVANALVTAGLGTIIEGTLASASDTITFTGDISGALLFIAGSTYNLVQGVHSGGANMVLSGGDTVVTFDSPIYGAPHQYIAVLFVS